MESGRAIQPSLKIFDFRQLVVAPLYDAYGTHGTQVRKHHSLLRQTGASLIIR